MASVSPAVPRAGMIGQFLRFGVVGVANTATCLAVVWSLHEAADVPVWLASVAGYAVAMVQSYLINRMWTFRGGGALPAGQQIGRFVLANLVCLALFTVLTSLFEPVLGVRIASLVAQVPTMLVSFFAMRLLVFRGPR